MYKSKILLAIIFFLNCSDEEKIRFTYYDNGKIKEKYVYQSKNDIKSFQAYLYSENGQLLKNATYKDGMLDGESIVYFDSGKISSIINYKAGMRNGKTVIFNELGEVQKSMSYKNDSLHGISRIFGKKNDLIKEFLYINGSQKVYREFYKNHDGSITKFVCYDLKDDSIATSCGELVSNTVTKIPIENLSFYYFINAPSDTIGINETFKANVKFFNEGLWNLELYLGELDENLNFTGNPQLIKSSNKTIDFKVKPKHNGINLLLGKIVVSNDIESNDENYEFIFYHEYYVKKQ